MGKMPKVLYVAAECSPYIKVGGLGDVAGELPVKLAELGADVRVVIPGNKDIDVPTRYIGDYPVEMGNRTETCIVREIMNAPVSTYIIDNYHYFGRQGVYGHRDDAERFAFFCLAVYELIRRFDFTPDILHLNDWHTAPLAMVIRENEREHSELSNISIVYTIHNLEYQGVCDRSVFRLYGVRDSVFMVDKVEYYGCFNPMKAGINYSDIINAVSRTSAHEMLTSRFGFGLEGVLLNRKQAVRGIVNGLDTINWDPETDKVIYSNYNKESLHIKKQNKKMLQKELGLHEKDVPLFAVVSRLVPNKGLDLMEPAFRYILKNDCQLVILGSGEKYYENIFMDLAGKYPGSASVNLEFNAEKARKIYSGSDILLMPSRYEPCGISQLIAMRYGTIPLVHKTGGLADTVIDVSKKPDTGNGFVFSGYSRESFIRTIKRALDLFEDREAWKELARRAMSSDHSWDRAAHEYLSLYNEAESNNNKRKSKGRKTLI
ncbi:MAG TPA: glycogen synthase [Clostridiaceae bacterium]|nr:glycogen synthase [Clostridiaceae bacterium]